MLQIRTLFQLFYIKIRQDIDGMNTLQKLFKLFKDQARSSSSQIKIDTDAIFNKSIHQPDVKFNHNQVNIQLEVFHNLSNI